ncbi:MAG: DegT/DnrJ/EryC1/StrS family aminotransferase [Clostridia bacterium]|nr:DegT/DnrJ/EryC1/StrS family aminotransferase [Clostridia bacterium]
MDKKINVTRPSMPSFDEYAAEIKSIWDSAMLTNFGPLEERLKGELEKFLGVKNLPLFTNGHQALLAAISVIALPGKSKVITTPFTFASTTEAIAGAGLKPVFADVDPVTYTLDPKKVEKLIDDDTAAIIPVHVYGNVCDTRTFEKLSEKYRIPVIYDAAHCFGVRKDGVGIGNFGTASMFSFHATKAFNTIEGGAAAVPEKYAQAVRNFANYGLCGGATPEINGTNSKMTEFQAAMGLCNLRHIGEVTEKRAAICAKYTEILTEGSFFDAATGVSGNGIKLIPYQAGVTKNYAYFPVIFGKAESDGSFTPGDQERLLKVIENLQNINVFPRRYFYPLISEFTCMKKYRPRKTPIAKRLSDNVLCLPLYAELSLKDAARIAKTVLR